jgi:hypothetical protein
MSDMPLFPHHNYDMTREQAHNLSEQGEQDIRQRNRTPHHSTHLTHMGWQTRWNDRPDQPGEGIGGSEPEPGTHFLDDF